METARCLNPMANGTPAEDAKASNECTTIVEETHRNKEEKGEHTQEKSQQEERVAQTDDKSTVDHYHGRLSCSKFTYVRVSPLSIENIQNKLTI